jgi:hypothetical protein
MNFSSEISTAGGNTTERDGGEAMDSGSLAETLIGKKPES